VSDKFTMEYIGKHVQFGNRKLPDTTAIWNCGAARDCPSRPLGLCQAGRRCYALNTERYMTNSLPYRRRQAEIMRSVPGLEIGAGILARCLGREKKVKLFRYGQAGDMADQVDVETLANICGVLNHAGIGCYGFTARTDLDLAPLLAVSNLGVSNDKCGWILKGANRFRIVAQASGDNLVCPKDCTICEACSTVRGQVIETVREARAQMTFNDTDEVCYCEEFEW